MLLQYRATIKHQKDSFFGSCAPLLTQKSQTRATTREKKTTWQDFRNAEDMKLEIQIFIRNFGEGW
jgi:hypothetical protein